MDPAGSADPVPPQINGYDIEAYHSTLDTQDEDSLGVSRTPRRILPGVLLNVGPYSIDTAYLASAVAYNRSRGYPGGVFFFEGLRRDANVRARLLKHRFYATPAPPPFPRFLNQAW